MNRTQWNDGIKAWNKVKSQAEIDIEQAELYISAINNKLETLPKEEKEVE